MAKGDARFEEHETGHAGRLPWGTCRYCDAEAITTMADAGLRNIIEHARSGMPGFPNRAIILAQEELARRESAS